MSISDRLGAGRAALAALLLAVASAGAWLALPVAQPAAAEEVVVYKSPSCGCCQGWIEHMRAAGFSVKARDIEDLDAVKRMYGVTEQLASCHTAVVGGYVVEGHVPADSVRRLLAERPEAKGLAAPGMPLGSPGMEADVKEPYDVLLFNGDGKAEVFERY